MPQNDFLELLSKKLRFQAEMIKIKIFAQKWKIKIYGRNDKNFKVFAWKS